MKQLFIFSRTYKVDYGVMVSPASDFCPIEVKKFFKEQVRGLLNVDQYTPDLTTPRWLLSRVGGLTLWGVGCWNETYGEECATDEAGRRHLRNFVGVVYSGDVQELPYDIEYFKAEFNRHIGNIWNVSRMDIQNKILSGVTPADYTGCKTIKGGVAPGLNTMPKRSVIINPAKAESIIGAALISKANVSIATNLLDVGLAFDERYQFLNASVINNPGGQVHTFTDSSKIPSVDVPQTDKIQSPKPTIIPPIPPVPPKLEPSKQDPPVEEKRRSDPFRIISIVELLIIIILVIAYCSKSGSTKTKVNEDKQEQLDKKDKKEKKHGIIAAPINKNDSKELFKEAGGQGKPEGTVDNDRH